MKHKNNFLNIGAFAVMIAAVLWAVDLIVLRPSLWHIDVFLVVFLEHLIAFAFMAIPFYIERNELKKLKRIDWIAFVFVAVFSGVIGTLAITKALFYVNFVNLSIVALLQKLQPVFAVFFAMIILKEKPKENYFIWAALALIGSYFVTFGFNRPIINIGNKVFLASMFAVLAAASWGSSTVFSKFATAKINFRVGTYIRFGLTTILMLFIVLVMGSLKHQNLVQPSNYLTLLIIAFTTGGVAIFIYYYGLKQIPASVSTICELMLPISAVVLEYALRGNVMNIGQWFGAFVLITSIFMISQGKEKVIIEKKKNWITRLFGG